VFHQPASPFVARFLGFVNLLDADVIQSDLVRTTIGELIIASPLPEDMTTATLLIRPEAARILHPEEHDKVNELRAKLKMLSFRGKYYQVWIEVADQTLMFEMPYVNGEIGDTIPLALDPSALRILPV
jgi:ABC-type Fe3+/spermidine/putrescine transport system ATPase subunit